jgi:hypothetical protein
MKHPLRMLSFLFGALALPHDGLAADHGDSPSALAEPTADVTDLYAWMSSDLSKLNLVLAVDPGAGPDATFSDAVLYVFSVSSSSAYGQPQQSARIICRFPDSVNIECWGGGEYVVGDPRDEAGIVSSGGKLKVFAGLRDDPFFLNYAGFGATVGAAVAAVVAGDVVIPATGCPALSTETGDTLRRLLTSGQGGNTPAVNDFAGQNVLALVVQIDTALVNSGGPILGVSANTHVAP